MVKVYDRKTKKYLEEKESGSKLLNFLYKNAVGRLLLRVLINPIISKIGGLYNDSSLSKLRIKKFIKTNNIDMSDFEKTDYKNFNEFFTRRIKENKRPFLNNKNSFISPADSKLTIYNITDDLKLSIKGSTYTLNELVNNEEDLSAYKNGQCLVFRLSVDDYHHYCYPDSGKTTHKNFIRGKLHTVRSVSSEYKIYKVNQREYSILKTDNFDEIIYIEVGAIMVGKIVNLEKEKFNKGEEKGYFKLGGSTIVILVKENKLKIDDDILKQSENEIETKVKYREKIGIVLKEGEKNVRIRK